MGRLFRILGVLLVLVLLVGSVLIYRVLNAAGNFNTVTAHFDGKCETVTGVVGGEDMELDRPTGTLFISSQDRRPAADGKFAEGALYLAHIDRPQDAPTPLAVGNEVTSFHPHGISLFADAAGRKTLAVVNHSTFGDEVMLFDVNDDRTASEPNVTLTLRRTVKDPLMHSLNDVTLVSHEAFYATNDHGSETELGKQLETWLLLPRANVIFYDGSAAKVAATGFNYANGINRNADASEIYVAEATGRALQTFRRDMTTGLLDHIHTLFLGVGPDNLDVDSEGAIWIGAHPKLLEFVAHAADKTKLSPSAVLKVTPAGEDTKFETIYVNMGEQLSGSSIAIHDKNRLVIGPVLDPKFLNCTLK